MMELLICRVCLSTTADGGYSKRCFDGDHDLVPAVVTEMSSCSAGQERDDPTSEPCEGEPGVRSAEPPPVALPACEQAVCWAIGRVP